MTNNESSNKKQKIVTERIGLSETVHFKISSTIQEPPTPSPKKRTSTE